jgi:hypothetical protein
VARLSQVVGALQKNTEIGGSASSETSAQLRKNRDALIEALGRR